MSIIVYIKWVQQYEMYLNLNSYTIDYNCRWYWWQNWKIQIFRFVSNERRIQCSNISSQLFHSLRYFCAYSISIIHTLYPVSENSRAWTIYRTQSNNRKSQYEFTPVCEQCIRSVQLNTNLLPLTRNDVSRSKFLCHFFSPEFTITSIKLKNLKTFGFWCLLIEIFAIFFPHLFFKVQSIVSTPTDRKNWIDQKL